MTSAEHDRLANQARELFAKVDACIVSGEAIGLIFNALRAAQNDKLEEARQRVLEGHDQAWGNPAEQHGWDQAAQRIEALKSKD